ncbi:class I SAM-dependent rRNA methyltransferase [soil metagenome]
MPLERSRVILSSGKDQSLRRFHPWVFSGAIKKIKGPVQEGDIVDVYSNQEEYLGTGHIQDGSIAIRIFSFEQIDPKIDFWKGKIQKALDYRKNIGVAGNKDTNVFRLIYAEGDGMPGMIVDFYNGVAVLQAHSIGFHIQRQEIANALKEVMGDALKAVYDKSSESLHRDGAEYPNSYLLGSSTGDGEIMENGNKFYVDWETGQKTGFFIDQRDNRALVAKYAKGKKVLNTFCYTGGFSVYAGNAGASEVHSVDSSKKAMALTDRNIELNGIKNHTSFAMDTFDFLKDKENAYDIIILDPPAFAKHMSAKHNAVMGYKRLNAEAIKMIRPGGLLFTFSCSQVVDRRLFFDTIMSAAIVAKRNVRVMHHLTQPADHPVNIFHPEGEYLKGLVVYVE